MTHEGKLSWPLLSGLIIIVLAQALLGCGRSPEAEILLEYRRSGGIIGRDDHLVIYRDGRAELKQTNDQPVSVSGVSQLNSLLTQLQEVNFRSLKDSYLPDRQGYDLFEYELTYRGRTVQTADGAIPTDLQPILDSLNEIIQSIESQS